MPLSLTPFFSSDRIWKAGAGRSSLGTRTQACATSQLTLWLPTNKFGPIPSPELLHDWQEDRTAPELRPWIVEGLWLEPSDAFDLLTALNNRSVSENPPGQRQPLLAAGHSILSWKSWPSRNCAPPWSRSGTDASCAMRLAGSPSSTASRTPDESANWPRPCRPLCACRCSKSRRDRAAAGTAGQLPQPHERRRGPRLGRTAQSSILPTDDQPGASMASGALLPRSRRLPAAPPSCSTSTTAIEPGRAR